LLPKMGAYFCTGKCLPPLRMHVCTRVRISATTQTTYSHMQETTKMKTLMNRKTRATQSASRQRLTHIESEGTRHHNNDSACRAVGSSSKACAERIGRVHAGRANVFAMPAKCNSFYSDINDNVSSHLRCHPAAPSTCNAQILRARKTCHLQPQPTSAGLPRGRVLNAP
jgi:hypothetical protein